MSSKKALRPVVQADLANIKPGQVLIVIDDTNKLAQYGVPSDPSQRQVTVSSIKAGNNTLACLTPNGCTYTYTPELLMWPAASPKARQFCRADAEAYAKEAGVVRLKSELTVRINNARNELSNAASPEKFASSIKLMNEQLRQARIIHSLI